MIARNRAPMAFLSYTRADDKYNKGQFTLLRDRLVEAVHALGVKEFEIFQDLKHIGWGQDWRQRITESLDQVLFFIPILTPSFFQSAVCEEETRLFLKRAVQLQRSDLLLPVYWMDGPVHGDLGKQPLAQEIMKHNFSDWRSLRKHSMDSKRVRDRIEDMARQICTTLSTLSLREGQTEVASASERVQVLEAPPSPANTPAGSAVLAPPPSRELVVETGGLYRSIKAALDASRPGDRILVKPGIYAEPLTLDKPVEIRGGGDRSQVVVRVEGNNAITARAAFGSIANLTIRQVGAGHYAGVLISSGSIILESCDISAEGHSGVAITKGADPRVRKNRITGCTRSGVWVSEGARGIIEANEVSENKFGITIAKQANPLVRQNRIVRNGSGGIWVLEQGQGMIEGNEIAQNEPSGIYICGEGSPTIVDNDIHDNARTGVLCYESGHGTLRANQIHHNGTKGVEIQDQSNPTLRHNWIHHNISAGVDIRKEGLGVLEHNDLFANGHSNIIISGEGANPTVRSNRIHHSKESGIFIYKGGTGTVEENEIYANKLAGVSLQDTGTPTLRRNRIVDGHSNGVQILKGGKGTLEDNEIIGNARYGARIESGASPTLSGNKVTRNELAGIRIDEGGGGVLENNDLRGNKGGPLDLAKGASPDLKRKGNKHE